MKLVDWSKAPEGAEAKGLSPCHANRWAWLFKDGYRYEDNSEYFSYKEGFGRSGFIHVQLREPSKSNEQCAYDYANEHGCPECRETVSPAWDGVGSPPAGVLIEMKHKNATAKWARPDFHEEQLAWVGRDHFVTVDEKFGALSDYLFRPICTPEQIAAEERLIAIKQICIDAESEECTNGQIAVATKLYDAGYRKVSP